MRLLWEVCQIPDFRKTLSDEPHPSAGPGVPPPHRGRRRLPADWVADQIARLDRTEGDIDTLIARIAHIRTWTYIAHRRTGASARHWQERTRAVEDRLSDALHQRLTQRFVDRRAALLVRRLRDEGEMTSSVAAAGEVTVEGEHLGTHRRLPLRS